jgi:hypothetical protein
MRKSLHYLCLAAVAMFAPTAWGAIVYVDATPNTAIGVGNTSVNGAFAVLGAAPPAGGANVQTGSSTGSGTDGFWHYRTDAASAGGLYWETDTTTSAGETTAPLITTISLGPGTYDLFGLFRPQASTHDIAFSLDGSSYTNFTTSNSLNAAGDGSDFSNPLDLNNIDHSIGNIHIASLGQVTLLSATTVSIFIQGPDLNVGGNNSGQRTRYEGVGYQLVPEPSSIILVTIGVLGTSLLVRRRQR